MPRTSPLLPDSVIARLVRNRPFAQKCLNALRAAERAEDKVQSLNDSLDQLEADGSLSQSERAAIRAEDIMSLSPDAVEAALDSISEADEINAA